MAIWIVKIEIICDSSSEAIKRMRKILEKAEEINEIPDEIQHIHYTTVMGVVDDRIVLVYRIGADTKIQALIKCNKTVGNTVDPVLMDGLNPSKNKIISMEIIEE